MVLAGGMWFASFLKAVLGQKKARYPSASVHCWVDPMQEGPFLLGEPQCSAGRHRGAWQAPHKQQWGTAREMGSRPAAQPQSREH